MNNTCFVVMPIGTQTIGKITITEEKLREKYSYIIKEAIVKAAPELEIIRADEELNPSSISNDIFTKLMHSRYVIADITYPNPNVFYELGIRHAISSGTILIREKGSVSIPFDISHLRYIEYTQEPSGMEKLSQQLKRSFEFYGNHPEKPDNQFLELCSFTNYTPTFFKKVKASNSQALYSLLALLLSSPDFVNKLTDNSLGDKERQSILIQELSKNPDMMMRLVQILAEAGFTDL